MERIPALARCFKIESTALKDCYDGVVNGPTRTFIGDITKPPPRYMIESYANSQTGVEPQYEASLPTKCFRLTDRTENLDSRIEFQTER